MQDHLARLGPATMGPDEIQLDGVAKLDAAERERMIAVVLRRGPELQACLANHPGVAMRTRVIVLGPRKDKPLPGRSIPIRRIPESASSWVESVGADAPPEAAKTCLENLTRALKFPAVEPGTRVQVTISVIAP